MMHPARNYGNGQSTDTPFVSGGRRHAAQQLDLGEDDRIITSETL